MSFKIAIAAEVRDLLTETTDDFEISWVKAEENLPPGDFDAVVTLLTRAIDDDFLAAHPDLRIVANVATGYDNVDLDAASRRGVVVTNTPDVLSEATADLTMAAILAVMRRIPEGIDLMRSDRWRGWHPTQLLGKDMNGAEIGIVGAGRIGIAVARRATGFGTRLTYVSRKDSPRMEELGARRLKLDELLSGADCVSLHVPLNDETRGLIGRRELDLMKPDAVLINTARGGIVNEEALADALDSGHLFGAALDVFEGEPHVKPRVLKHPRILTLPHIGSATQGTRSAMANLAFRNVVAVLEGRPPLTPVVVDGAHRPT